MFNPPPRRRKKNTSLQTWFTIGLICVVAVVFLAVFILIADEGSDTFLALSDTPNTYTGQGGRYVAVNAGATGLEFVVGGGTDAAQDLWLTFQADSGSSTASSTTDAFTFTGGANITTAISGDVVTITGTGVASGTPPLSAVMSIGNTASTDLDMDGNAIINSGTLNVDGVAYLNGSLQVTGVTALVGPTTITGDLGVTGQILSVGTVTGSVADFTSYLNLPASSGTPPFQAVTDVGNTTTNSIDFAGGTVTASLYLDADLYTDRWGDQDENTIIGVGAAGDGNMTGDDNTLLGYQTGKALTSGQDNTLIGRGAGSAVTDGDSNVFLGRSAGLSIISENQNTFLGAKAGESGTSSSGCVFIGFDAGSDETGDNLLYIENSNSATPLIWGDFSADEIVINGSLQATDYYSGDGTQGATASPSGLVFKDGLYISGSPSGGGTPTYAQTVTVGKSGSVQFNTIQGAIDSITDNSVDKPYSVLIYSGLYTEDIVMEDYVSLVGIGDPASVIIYGTNSDPLIQSSSDASYEGIFNLTVSLEPTATGQIVVSSGTGVLVIQNCNVLMTSSTNDIVGTLIDTTGDTLWANSNYMKYEMTGTHANVKTHSVIQINGNSTYFIDGSPVDIIIGDVNDTAIWVNEHADAVIDQAIIKNCITTMDFTNTDYSGTSGIMYMHGYGLSQNFTGNDITVTGTTSSGTFYGIYIDTASDNGIFHAANNAVDITGFETIYGSYVGAGDEFVSSFDCVTAKDGATGPGTFTVVQTPSHGNLIVSGSITANAFYGDGSNLTGIAVGGGTPTYAQTVTVAKSGSVQFNTIQGAIDSITDNATDKRYMVLIYPGIYTENVVMEEYVSLVGFDHEVTKIISTSGITVTAPPGASDAAIANLKLESTPTADGAEVLRVTTGEVDIYSSYLKMTSSTNDVEGVLLNLDGGDIEISHCDLTYDLEGSSDGDVRWHRVIDIDGTSTLHLLDSAYVIEVADGNDNVVAIDEASAAAIETHISNCDIHMHLTSGTYSGITGFVYSHGTSIEKELNSNIVWLETDSGDGTAYGIYMDTGDDNGVIYSTANQIHVTGFSDNYGLNVATGDTVNSHFDDVVADGGNTGAGTINAVQSPSDGDFVVTGLSTLATLLNTGTLTVTGTNTYVANLTVSGTIYGTSPVKFESDISVPGTATFASAVVTGTVSLPDTTYQTVLTPSGAIIGTSAAPAQTLTEGTNFVYYTLDYSPSVDQYAYWEFLIPDSYTGGDITPTIYWTGTPTANDVVWCVKVGGRADTEQYDSALSGTQTATTTIDGTTMDINTTAISAFDPSWDAGDIVIVNAYRNGTSGSDDMVGVANMIMMEIAWPSER